MAPTTTSWSMVVVAVATWPVPSMTPMTESRITAPAAPPTLPDGLQHPDDCVLGQVPGFTSNGSGAPQRVDGGAPDRVYGDLRHLPGPAQDAGQGIPDSRLLLFR